jgi:hypothetical protein
MYTPRRFKRPLREEDWAKIATTSTLDCGLTA